MLNKKYDGSVYVVGDIYFVLIKKGFTINYKMSKCDLKKVVSSVFTSLLYLQS